MQKLNCRGANMSGLATHLNMPDKEMSSVVKGRERFVTHAGRDKVSISAHLLGYRQEL
jgi:hypothetical protein